MENLTQKQWSVVDKIIQLPFPKEQYIPEVVHKDQIVLHHTASGSTAVADANYWKSTPERVATAFIIDRNGTIYQCFSSGYWAYHLGMKANMGGVAGLDKGSIGIELDSWGILTEQNGKYYSWTKEEVPKERVQVYPKPFRGSKYYEKYTAAQLQSAKELVQFLAAKYKIPTTYRPEIFDVDKKALSKVAGTYTHVSFRKDKSDCHPQPELIAMLKSL